MDWQLAIVTAILIAAVAYIGRAIWRTWSPGSGGCRTACGGCAGSAGRTEHLDGRRITLPQI